MRRAAALAVCAVLLTGCGGGPRTVEGVVTDLSGDLTAVEWFEMRLPDGSDLRLTPEPGLLFHGEAPVSHLRDHILTGDPIEVTYTEQADGSLVATAIGDA